MKKLNILLGEILAYYKKEGRGHLPWRKTKDPYKILVSEIMLQQTQVDRVIPKYRLFIKKFPTVKALAAASLKDVLALWSGLGYNRRGKYLHAAAKILAADSATELTTEFLQTLPGVGPYTARAICAFAFNTPEVFVETNIRTVFLHFCFPKISRLNLDKKISDKEILPFVEKALALAMRRGVEPRDFYAALMDYGAFLKAQGVKLNSQSKHYAKQSKFEGSARQLRGAILRALLQQPATVKQIMDICAGAQKSVIRTPAEIERELARLQKEKFIIKVGSKFAVAA